MIELGRYNQNTRDNRNCLFCGSNQIEDEIHVFVIVLNKGPKTVPDGAAHTHVAYIEGYPRALSSFLVR